MGLRGCGSAFVEGGSKVLRIRGEVRLSNSNRGWIGFCRGWVRGVWIGFCRRWVRGVWIGGEVRSSDLNRGWIEGEVRLSDSNRGWIGGEVRLLD